MPKQKDLKQPSFLQRTPSGIAVISSIIGLFTALGGLVLLVPKVMELFKSGYEVSYDYVVIPDQAVSCVATKDRVLTLGDKQYGILQNACQRDVADGVARNDVYRVWYVRVANSGKVDIPKISVVQPDRTSSFRLAIADTTLACLGYEGRPGRGSKSWEITRLELADGQDRIKDTIAVGSPPTLDQLKTQTSSCSGAIVGYPPL